MQVYEIWLRELLIAFGNKQSSKTIQHMTMKNDEYKKDFNLVSI